MGRAAIIRSSLRRPTRRATRAERRLRRIESCDLQSSHDGPLRSPPPASTCERWGGVEGGLTSLFCCAFLLLLGYIGHGAAAGDFGAGVGWHVPEQERAGGRDQ